MTGLARMKASRASRSATGAAPVTALATGDALAEAWPDAAPVMARWPTVETVFETVPKYCEGYSDNEVELVVQTGERQSVPSVGGRQPQGPAPHLEDQTGFGGGRHDAREWFGGSWQVLEGMGQCRDGRGGVQL